MTPWTMSGFGAFFVSLLINKTLPWSSSLQCCHGIKSSSEVIPKVFPIRSSGCGVPPPDSGHTPQDSSQEEGRTGHALETTAQSEYLYSPKLNTMATDPAFVLLCSFYWLKINPSIVKRVVWAIQAPKAYKTPVALIHMVFLTSAFLWLQTFTLCLKCQCVYPGFFF